MISFEAEYLILPTPCTKIVDDYYVILYNRMKKGKILPGILPTSVLSQSQSLGSSLPILVTVLAQENLVVAPSG
jgi:hypothetical protein